MQEFTKTFKHHVREAAANPNFIHHPWFVKWHLEIVEKIAFELLEYYPEADRDAVEVGVWLHDYGKILDFDSQYDMTLRAGREKLQEIGFDAAFVDTVMRNVELLDRKEEIDIAQTPIEVQIVSSADGCSHLTGPFMPVHWQENASLPFDELLPRNAKKARKDWYHKIVLPEARTAFEARYKIALEQSGELPERFIGY